MKNPMLTWLTVGLLLATGGSAVAEAGRNSREADTHSLARRVSALESLVERQARQIDVLQKALIREGTARRANDASLRLQITNALHSPFSPAEIETLQGVAAVTSVAQTNIYIAGNICVAGNLAVGNGGSLFVSHIQPSDGACGGDAAGITVFDGNVGIQATNTLFVNTIMPFQLMPALPEEWSGVRIRGNALWEGGIFFRTW